MKNGRTLSIVMIALVCAAVLAPKIFKSHRTNSQDASRASNGSPATPSQRLVSVGDVHNALLKESNPDRTKTLLADWQTLLRSLPPEAAAKMIRDFLETKKDAPTHLPFALAPGGSLKSAPTLRTFLLDELARVDKRGATAEAKAILTGWSSPEEWALALRNYAQGSTEPAKDAYLTDRMRQLLHYEPWQADPSAGYLESFDVAVYLGGTNFTPALCDLARRKDNQALAHASYLALDRLTLANTTDTLQLLQSQPELLSGREETRANFFARADVGQSAQRQIIESYLLNPKLSGAELQTFAGLFPNANYMVSYNLLTPVNTPDGATLAQRDARALQAVNDWLADERFSRMKPQLEAMRARIESYRK
ncbi:MAG TPA: hypothetical protein VGE41_13835 [Verrucomicrobiae bacterium]|jgi:hypothetical protein